MVQSLGKSVSIQMKLNDRGVLSTNEECSSKDLHSGTENKRSEFQKHRIMMGTMGSPRDKLLPVLIEVLANTA